MPIYSIEGRDGKTYEIDGPDGLSREQVIAEVLRRAPQAGQAPAAAPKPTERTWGEAATDIGAGVVKGVGSLVQLPGQLYGLATGDFADTGLLGAGKDIEEYGESLKSQGLKEREAARARAVQGAEGQLDAFKTSFLETVKDPALLSSFVAEQLPQLIPIIASGGLGAAAAAGRTTAAELAKGATKEAAAAAARAAAARVGTTAAIQTGAVMQGTDVGASTYDAIYQNVLQRTNDPQQAADAALNRARAAGVAGYGLSVLANRYLPGGQALEKALTGPATGRGLLAAGAAGALKEIPSENVEEVGGALARNIALQSVDPTQALTQGLGETAAQATLGAAALGGAAGAYSGRGPAPVPAPTPPAPPTPPADETADAGLDEEAGPVDPATVLRAEEYAARMEATNPQGAKELREAAARLRAKAAQAAIPKMSYAEAVKQRAALRAGPQTAATKSTIDALSQRITDLGTAQVQGIYDEQAQAEKAAKQADRQAKREARAAQRSAFSQEMPDLFGQMYPEAAPQAQPEAEPEPIQQDVRQLPLFEGEQPGLFGMMPPAPEAEPEAEAAPERPDMRQAALQMPLLGRAPARPRASRAAPAGQAGPEATPVVESAAPVETPLTLPEIEAAMPRPLRGKARTWAQTELVGKTRSEVAAAVQADPTLIRGAGPQPQVYRALLEGARDVTQPSAPQPTRSRVRPEPAPAAPAAEPGVEAPVGVRGGPDVADAAGAVAPDGAGVAPVPGVAAVEPEPESEQPPAVAAATPNAFTIPAKSAFLREQEGETPMGRRVKGSRYRTPEAQGAPRQAIGDAPLRRIVDRVTKSLGLKSGAGITILDSVTQLDPRERPGSRSGAVTEDGQIYLFRDGIADGVEGEKSVFHELLHSGLRNLYSTAEYVRVMRSMYQRHTEVQQAADAWLADPDNADVVAKYQNDPALLQAIAVDESLATLAEQRKTPGLVRALGNWFANLASRVGLTGLARTLRTMGMTELEAFVDDALRAAGAAPVRAGAPTRFRSAKPKAQQVATVAQTDKMLAALDMQPVPQKTRMQQALGVLADTKENPRAAAQDLRKAATTWVDKFGTAFFSSNFAFNAEIKRQLRGTSLTSPEAMGLQLAVSDSQVDGSSVLAGLFARVGNLVYDSKLYKWVAQQGTSMADVAKTLSDMGQTHGLSKEQASQVVDAYFEARRTQGLLDRNDELSAAAAVLEAAGDKKQAEKFRARRVEGLKDRAWVAQALQFEQMFPELVTAAEQWNEVRKNAAKVMVDSGLWTPEEAETLLSVAEYVPFYREDQLAEGAGPKEFMSGLQVRAKEARLRGSEAKVNDIFDNMMRWTQFAIERAVRNHMAIQRMDAAVQFKLAEPVDFDSKDPNKVTIWRDGRQESYKMADPLFMDAFKGLESLALPSLGFWAKLTNVFRQSVVLNPLFGILQVPQDAVAAIYTSGLKPRYAFSIPARAAKEFVQTLLTPEKSAVHRELRALGAVGARDTTAEVVKMDLEILEGARSELGFSTQLVRRIGKLLHHVAMASDSAVRQAVYTASLDQGLSQAEAVEKSFQLVNFRNRGTSKGLAAFARVVPFLNAYMAAQHVAYKTLSGTGISPADRKAALETLAATTLGMMGLSAIYAMALGGDEGYEKRPLYVRDRVFVIPGTDGISIPIRADIFSFPKVFAEHMWHHITDSGTVDGANTRKSMAALLGTSFIGPYAPQLIKPLVEVGVNYDFFRQRPLVGANLSNAETEYQFTDSTSELGKLVGQSGLMSPITFDHLMRGYLGSFGGLVLYTTNAVSNTMGGVPRPDMSLWDAIASFPGVSSVMPKQNDSALRQDFYDLKESVDRVAQTITLLNGRDPEELDAYLANDDVMALDAIGPEVRSIYKELTEIRKEMSLVRADRDLTAEEKRVEIEALQQEELDLLGSIDIKALRAEAGL